MKCDVSHCSQPSTTKGYCSPHYQRFYRGKDPEQYIITPPKGTCPAADCHKPANPGTVCPKHAADIRLHRIPPIPGTTIEPNPLCIFPECDRPSRQTYGGLCRSHLAALSAGEPLTPLRMRSGLEYCAEPSCEQRSEVKGVCRPHYARERQRIAQQNYDYKMKPCVTEGCLKKTSSETGYCAQHKRQMKVAGTTWAKGKRPNLGTCLVDKCETPTFNPGQICKLHRSRARMYSLTDEQIIAMLHDAECAICARVDDLNIDHDHACCPGEQSCGKCVRGILCRSCNTALGYAKDSTETLEGMIAYLKKSCE